MKEEIRRRAVAVAKGVALAPFAVFGVLFIVMLPGGITVNAARVRIAIDMSRAPFPAGLAVWRADQPAGDLTEAFDALHERID